MKLSLCITTYNRSELTIKSFEQVMNDPRIDQIVILDDHSDIEHYKDLCIRVGKLIAEQSNDVDSLEKKIKVDRNRENLGMSRNKYKAVAMARNEWCILFDSDNIMTPAYLNALEKDWTDGGHVIIHPRVIWSPAGAMPNFNYTEYAGVEIRTQYAKDHLHERMFDCLMNTCNYVVHRDTYMNVYQTNPDVKGSDTIWFNYLWLKAGGSIYVVPGMYYDHLVHDGSGWKADAAYNIEQAKKTKNLIQQL